MDHLVFFQQNAVLGATEDYFRDLMEGVDKRRFSVTFLCPEGAVIDPVAREVEAYGVRVLRYRNTASAPVLIWKLARLFRELRPDLVHFNDPCIAGMVAARLAGVTRMLMSHHTPLLDRRYSVVGRLLERAAFGCNPYVAFSSEYDRQTAIRKEGWDPAQTITIAHGLDLDRFSNPRPGLASPDRPASRPVVLGNVARLSPQKGQKYLLEALSLLKERGKRVRLVIAGEGEIRGEIEAEIGRRGLTDDVEMTGHRADIPDLLNSFDILVMPSLFEGLCYAVLEASAMELPVVATAVGGVRYSVQDGITGILVPPADAVALADAIAWMIDHPVRAAAMGKAGRERVLREFTKQRMVERTQSLYLDLLQ